LLDEIDPVHWERTHGSF